MGRKYLLAAGAALSVGLTACTATGGAPSASRVAAPAQGASVQSVTQSFVDAVAEYCVRYVLLEEDLADIERSNDRLSSISSASGPRAMMRRLDEAYVLDDAGDIVMLEVANDGDECRVSAYGPPARTVLDTTAQIVATKWRGEPLEVEQDPSPLVIDREVLLRRDGRAVKVYLGGNEPGAPGRRSRFSTLSASVSLIEPDAPA